MDAFGIRRVLDILLTFFFVLGFGQKNNSLIYKELLVGLSEFESETSCPPDRNNQLNINL